MVEAMKELNIPIAKDQANGNAIGGYFCPHNQDPTNLTRSSAREAYYNNFADRHNLHLIPEHQVTKLLTSSSSGSATVIGVEVRSSTGPSCLASETHTMSFAVCGGCICTPPDRQCQKGGDTSSWFVAHSADPSGFRHRRVSASFEYQCQHCRRSSGCRPESARPCLASFCQCG